MTQIPHDPSFPYGHMPRSFESALTFFNAADCVSETPAELRTTTSTPFSPNSPFLSGYSSATSVYGGEDSVETELFAEYPLRSVSDPTGSCNPFEEQFQRSRPLRYVSLRIQLTL
jgi:hypothetical protein